MSVLTLESMAILILAPSRVLGVALQRELKDMGAQQMASYQTMASAIQHVGEKPVDVIISSLYFEDGDAIELMQYLQQEPQLQHIKLILISSEERSELLDKAKASGIQAILPRPFTHQAFEHALASCVNPHK